MAQQRPKPSPPDRATAWLWIGNSRLRGVGMIASGSGLTLAMALEWATRRHPMVSLLVAMTILGALIALVGVRILLRKTPVIAADERGVFVSTLGLDVSLLPWDVVGGAHTFGSGGRLQLVILADDVEAALKHVYPALVKNIRAMNRKQRLPGAAYIMGTSLGTPAPAVARQIRDLLGATDRTDELVGTAAGAVGA